MFKNLALVLLVAWSASADRMPTLKFNLNHNKIGNNPSPENILGECQLESQVSDKFSLGATLAIGAEADTPIRNIFTRVSERVAGQAVNADLELGLSPDARHVSGEIEFGKEGGGGTLYTATVNSNHRGSGGPLNWGVPFVEKLRLKSSGPGWTVAPSIHTNDFKVDLEAESKLGDATTCRFAVDGDGGAQVQLDCDLDSDTTLTLESATGLSDVKMSLKRRMGESDTFTPTLRAASKDFSLDWRHEFSSGRSLTTTFHQGHKTLDMELKGQSDSDWTAKVSAPFNAPKDLDVSFGRKLSARSLTDLSFGSLRGN